jgi:hypothetical protein
MPKCGHNNKSKYHKQPFSVRVEKLKDGQWKKVKIQTKRKRTQFEYVTMKEETETKLKEINKKQKIHCINDKGSNYKNKEIAQCIGVTSSSIAKIGSRATSDKNNDDQFRITVFGSCYCKNCFKLINNQVLTNYIKRFKQCSNERDENSVLSELFTCIQASTRKLKITLLYCM